MNLPPHGARICLGVDLHGVKETCSEPVERGSMFPFCAYHRQMIESMKPKRTCAGAIIYDHAMRKERVKCSNATGHEEIALCASCRVLEKRAIEKARVAQRSCCPHCGQPMPQRSSENSFHQPGRPPPTYPSPSQGRSYAARTSLYGQGVQLFQPRRIDESSEPMPSSSSEDQPAEPYLNGSPQGRRRW